MRNLLGIAIARGSEDSILSTVVSFLQMSPNTRIDMESTAVVLNKVAFSCLAAS